MKTPILAFGHIALGLIFFGSAAIASDDSLVTAVYSNISNGYQRQKLPDGTFKREYYALSNGGYVQGVGRNDSIDSIPFSTIAALAGKYLGKQNYLLAENSKSAELLITISWGRTTPFGNGAYRNAQDGLFSAMNQVQTANQNLANGGPEQAGRSADGIQSPGAALVGAAQSQLEGDLLQMQMFNGMREKANEWNARLLGYSGEINDRNNPSRFAGAGTAYDELIEDIESERYYIIVAAYDFKTVTESKKLKLLWNTRISIQTRGNRFDEAMAAMMASAARRFGQPSGGLIRNYETGYKVEYGELKTIGIVPEAAPAPKREEEK